jgi:hypothetical protein
MVSRAAWYHAARYPARHGIPRGTVACSEIRLDILAPLADGNGGLICAQVRPFRLQCFVRVFALICAHFRAADIRRASGRDDDRRDHATGHRDQR